MLRRLVQVALLLGLIGLAAAAATAARSESEQRAVRSSGQGSARVPNGLRVTGNRLVDRSGRLVVLRGVNRSGTEYACIQGWGIFDGPSDSRSVAAIASWKANAVRVPLNEQCWLGLPGVKGAYAGVNYRRAIVRYVRLLQRHGMYVELALMWAAPGSAQATYQPAAPNADHSPAFWRSLARTFRRDPNVILAPWGETTVSARCFLKGGCRATFGSANTLYRVAGMQQAVSVMRRAGYRGVIAIPGIDYANNLTHWLSHRPHDPPRQLIAEAHVYGKNVCDDTACFAKTFAPVARRVPLIFGETGETYDGSSCGSQYISTFVNWAERHRVGYLAWTWNTWGNCLSLIKSFAGEPFSEYGSWLRAHLVSRSR